jgi:hypothetical protein
MCEIDDADVDLAPDSTAVIGFMSSVGVAVAMARVMVMRMRVGVWLDIRVDRCILPPGHCTTLDIDRSTPPTGLGLILTSERGSIGSMAMFRKFIPLIPRHILPTLTPSRLLDPAALLVGLVERAQPEMLRVVSLSRPVPVIDEQQAAPVEPKAVELHEDIRQSMKFADDDWDMVHKQVVPVREKASEYAGKVGRFQFPTSILVLRDERLRGIVPDLQQESA